MTRALTLLEILAIVMFGEAGVLHDEIAAKAVGHVYMNRLEHGGWGFDPVGVMSGFHSYDGVEIGDVPEEYFHWSQDIIDRIVVYSDGYELNNRTRDYTNGSYFIFSWQDMNNLFGLYGPYMRQQADWKSIHMIGSDGLPYGLFAYKRWPELDCKDDDVREYTGFLIDIFDMPRHTCCQLLQGEWK